MEPHPNLEMEHPLSDDLDTVSHMNIEGNGQLLRMPLSVAQQPKEDRVTLASSIESSIFGQGYACTANSYIASLNQLR